MIPWISVLKAFTKPMKNMYKGITNYYAEAVCIIYAVFLISESSLLIESHVDNPNT